MNKSLLLVICDFLLLSLLGLANFEEPATAQETQEVEVNERSQDARDDLISMLEESLREESSEQKELQETLAQKDQALAERERALAAKEQTLQETQKNLQSLNADLQQTSQQLTAAEKEKLELQKKQQAILSEKEKIALERERLAQSAQTLASELDQTKEEVQSSQQKIASLEKNISLEKEERAATLEQAQFLREELLKEKKALEEARKSLAEKEAQEKALVEERLAAQRKLEVVAAQNQVLQEQVETQRVQQEILQVRTERLTQGVEELAKNSTDLQETVTRDIAERKTLSANQLYDFYKRNKVSLAFIAREMGAFGLGEKVTTYRMESPVIEQGGSFYVIIHRKDLPFREGEGKMPLELRGAMEVDGNKFPVSEMILSARDSQVFWIPVARSFISQNQIEAFPLEQDALRFSEGILVSDQSGYYGALSLRLHPEKRSYIRVDDRIVTRLFGEFSASGGDFIFSNKGTFLGMMIDGSSGVLLEQLSLGERFPIGNRYDPARLRATLN